jgi:FMN reductase
MRRVNSPYIVAVGGTLRAGSSTEKAMRHVLRAAERAGARTRLISGPALELPMYQPDNAERTDAARDLVAQLALADGIVLGSPGYHGSISGLVKNALDYAEDLRGDVRPYFSGCGQHPRRAARHRARTARLAHALGRRHQLE